MCRNCITLGIQVVQVEFCRLDLLPFDFAHDGDTLIRNKRREPHIFIVARGAEGLGGAPIFGLS